jgi:hypothetical protein
MFPSIQEAHVEPSVSPLGMATVTPWRWPAHLALAQRMESTRD